MSVYPSKHKIPLNRDDVYVKYLNTGIVMHLKVASNSYTVILKPSKHVIHPQFKVELLLGDSIALLGNITHGFYEGFVEADSYSWAFFYFVDVSPCGMLALQHKAWHIEPVNEPGSILSYAYLQPPSGAHRRRDKPQKLLLRDKRANGMKVCGVHLVADMEFFEKIGKSDPVYVRHKIILTFTKVVEVLREANFRTQKNLGSDYTVYLKSMTIHTTETSTELYANYLGYDPKHLLELFASRVSSSGDACLEYLFTGKLENTLVKYLAYRSSPQWLVLLLMLLYSVQYTVYSLFGSNSKDPMRK